MQRGSHVSKDALDKILEGLPCLDRADQTIEINQAFSSQGGCSDVYHAKITMHGKTLSAAVKRIRVSFYEDEVFAKVRTSMYLDQEVFTDMSSEFCKGVGYMGKIKS